MHDTQMHLKEWMRNKINRNMTRNPFQRREIEARNLRTVSQDARYIREPKEKPDPFRLHLQLTHRANPDGITVLNLPKQPFGTHPNYNDKPEFMQNHVVMKGEVMSANKVKLLDEVIRRFRLSKKKAMSKVVTGVRRRAGSLDMQNKDYDEFVTATGRLWCPREKLVEACYEEQKLKYQLANYSPKVDKAKELLVQLRKIRSPPASAPFERLYMDGFRERRTTAMSIHLCTKYSSLFSPPSPPAFSVSLPYPSI